VNSVDLVYHIPQQVAADHTVDCAPEDGGNHIPPIASVRTLQAAQVGEEPLPFAAIGPHCLILADKGDESVSGDAVLFRSPISPAVRRLDGRTESLAR